MKAISSAAYTQQHLGEVVDVGISEHQNVGAVFLAEYARLGAAQVSEDLLGTSVLVLS